MSVQDEVRTAEAARCAAMLAGDVAQLDALLSEGLTFVHANGGADDKQALLGKIAAGGILYHSISWSDPQIDVRGAVAAMSGIMTLEVTVAGVAKTLHNRVIVLWESAAGTWRVFHFQSTPIAQAR